MPEAVHTETDAETGVTLKIEYDQDGSHCDPTENDEAIIMAALHRNYVNPAKARGLTSPEAIAEFAEENKEDWEEFPLFMYDHSGTVYRVSRDGQNPFSCRWDSGRLGSVFVKRADVGGDPFAAAVQFCEVYTAWANGNVFGYVVENAEGEDGDSCWGYIETDPTAEDSYVLQCGREAMKAAIENVQEARGLERGRIAAMAREFNMKPMEG